MEQKEKYSWSQEGKEKHSRWRQRAVGPHAENERRSPSRFQQNQRNQ